MTSEELRRLLLEAWQIHLLPAGVDLALAEEAVAIGDAVAAAAAQQVQADKASPVEEGRARTALATARSEFVPKLAEGAIAIQPARVTGAGGARRVGMTRR